MSILLSVFVVAVALSVRVAASTAVAPTDVRCPFTGARLNTDNKNPHGPGHPGHAASHAPKSASAVHAAFGDAPVALPRIQDTRRFRVTGAPPARVPLDAELLHALTRGGRVALENRYIDDTLGGASHTHFIVPRPPRAATFHRVFRHMSSGLCHQDHREAFKFPTIMQALGDGSAMRDVT